MRKLLYAVMIMMMAGPTLALADESNRARLDITAPDAIHWQGNGTNISVWTEDARRNPVPGNTADGKPLQLQGDLAAVINAAATTALKKRGYTVVQAGGRPDRALQLRIRSLVYSVKKHFFTTDVTVTAAIEAVATHGAKKVIKQLQSQNDYEVALTPSAKKNGEMVSATVHNALNAVFSDPDIAALLQP